MFCEKKKTFSNEIINFFNLTKYKNESCYDNDMKIFACYKKKFF